MQYPRESLPEAVAAVFSDAATAAGSGMAPGGSPQLATATEWAELLSSLTAAGLLPQAQLLEASRELALPASLAQCVSTTERATANLAIPRAF